MNKAEITAADLDVLEFDEEDFLIESNLTDVVPTKPLEKPLDTTLSEGGESTDLLQIFLRDVAKFRLLTGKEEVQLAKLKDAGSKGKSPCCHLCKSAAEGLVNHNLRMVMAVATRYHRGQGIQGVAYLDLIQEGTLGLMRAVELYDHTKLSKSGQSYRFSTYAMWWIRQSISKGLGEKSRTIRVPTHMIEKLGRLSAVKKQFRTEVGREPTLAELAEWSGLKTENVSDILRGTAIPISLSRKDPNSQGRDDEGGSEFASALEDAASPSPHDVAAQGMDIQDLSSVLSKLSPRSRDIIEKRFGLNGEEEVSLTDIGREWGITYQRVRQIEIEVLSKLRAHPDLQTLREN